LAEKEGAGVEDMMQYVKVKDFKKEAIEYSVRHQVLSEYTAFLCVGSKLIDSQFQEFQSRAVTHVHVEQPTPINFSSIQKSKPSRCMGPNLKTNSIGSAAFDIRIGDSMGTESMKAKYCK
jgi:hypothetical protein